MPSPQPFYQSFLRYRRARYLWLALALCLASIASYLLHSPRQPANGGTWLGYTLGTIGALLILWLLWFGIRKRRYHSRLGTVQGWLSAHVYLGGSLIVVVTLHTGFQFGLNVHSFAYALMVLVLASGVYGVVVYQRYPQAASGIRRGRNRDSMLTEIAELDQHCLQLAQQLGPEVADAIDSGIAGVQLGGSVRAQLSGSDHSIVVLPINWDTHTVPNPNQSALIDWLAERLSLSEDALEVQRSQELVHLLGNKKNLLQRLRSDTRLQAQMDIWRYLHVPLSIALLAALLAHVIAVFVYW